MNSWDNYYKEFNGKLCENSHLIISLLDNDESIKLLTKLGYKSDPEGKTLKDCKVGSYYFCYTEIFLNPNDEEETEIETIDVHHLLTEEDFFEIESREIDFGHPFVEKWFGIKTKYIVNLAAMDMDQ